MIQNNKPIGVAPSNPGIATEIEGAPVSMPGGNDGSAKSPMTGTAVASASVPPPITSDLAGAPEAGQEVVSAKPIEAAPAVTAEAEPPKEDDGAESKPVPASDTEHEETSPTEEEKKRAEEERERAENERQRAEAVAGSDRQIKTIQDWMNAEENRPETAEQRKKRERREKSKKIIAAISDGIGALSNLFFTSQYAPNMYNHEKSSMTNAVDARIEKLKAEREKKRDQYLNFSLKLGDIENDRAKTLRELEAQKLAREEAQRKAEQHNWLALLQPDKQREQAGKADKAEQDARTAKAEADNAPALQAAKLNTEKARGEAQRASASASRASAANSYASARAHDRSNVSEFSAWDEHGNEHKFRTKAAAEAYAKQHGTWKEEDVNETTSTEKTDARGKKSSTSQTKTKKGGHAGKPDPTDMDDPTA